MLRPNTFPPAGLRSGLRPFSPSRWHPNPAFSRVAPSASLSTHLPRRATYRRSNYRRFENSRPPPSLLFLRNKYALYAGGAAVSFYLYNLDQAPFTHRLRFLWVPYWLETKIGDYSYSQMLAQYRGQLAPESDATYVRVRRVMERLLAAAVASAADPAQARHLRQLQWHVHVIHAPNDPPNAFVLPNGKIFVFLSILPICRDDDGLATVLSHELSHQLAHHLLEQLGMQPLYIALSSVLYMATGILGFNDLLVSGLLQMPASREMELEADRIGCELMARLCFDVRAAVGFWERMDRWEHSAPTRAGKLAEFLSTHPNTTKRIADIRSWMPAMLEIREASDCYMSAFEQVQRSFFGGR